MPMNKQLKAALIITATVVFFTPPLYAQFFANTPSANQSSSVQTEKITVRNQQTKQKPTGKKTVPTRAEAVTPFDYGNQQFMKKETAKAKKNTKKERSVRFGPESNKKDQELIMMYMKDFRVYRTSSGQTRCSMQFALVTTLPSRLSNISYRLQWPKMSTVLSFNNVMPEVENHYNYSLLGDGCYSTDKTPNIVINRCRIKGITQQACASKVRWITRRQ